MVIGEYGSVSEKLASEKILSSKVKRESAKVKLIEKKIATLKRYKEIFVRKHGEEQYEEKEQQHQHRRQH